MTLHCPVALEVAPIPTKSPEDDRILLVGNPNVGKSLLFGLLTQTYVAVSNYPGTTVEIAGGTLKRSGGNLQIIDTPGVNTLIPTSEDEKVTRDILLEGRTRMVLQVGDSRNLRRALLLTVQLAEMRLPMVLCLNMADEAERAGVHIERELLSILLGVPCVQTVGVRRKGLRELQASVEAPAVSGVEVRYDPEVEAAVKAMEPLLPEGPLPQRAMALMLLAGDETLTDWLHKSVSAASVERIRRLADNLARSYGEPVSLVIQRNRLRTVEALLKRVHRNGRQRPSGAGRALERASIHPVWGVPILLASLAATFLFVGWFGAGVMVDFLEGTVFGEWVNPFVERWVGAVLPFEFLHDMIVGEYGLLTMALSYSLAVILPIVATFFLAFGVLEDSGYLPRLAVMVNRVFRVMGLNGKAVLPMVLGLGCDTMATLTARILPSKKERVLVTLLLALAVPCSAQLGVILGLLAGLPVAATAIWVGMLVGIMVLVGWLAAKLLPGERSDFILELPPLRLPRAGNLLTKTLGRVEWYLKEAVPLFVAGTFLLFLADRVGFLTFAERIGRPVVVTLLGLPEQATEMFLMGFLRRDFGAAGLFRMSEEGLLTPLQVTVSLVVITLFVPCIANLLMMIKERGWRTALAIAAFIFPFAVLVGALLNFALRSLGVTL
jgi:ferrous iron transport protein B